MPNKIISKTLKHMNNKKNYCIMTKDLFHQENNTIIILYTWIYVTWLPAMCKEFAILTLYFCFVLS